jgi:hypothetical protein
MSAPPDPTLLGARVAEALGEGPSARRRLAQRERLVRAAMHEARAPRRFVWIAAVAAAVIASASLWLVLRDPSPEVMPDELAEHDGRWLQAPEDGAVQIDLAEGTWVRVVEGGRARVATTSTDDGRISLESGRIEVEVDPAAGRSWTVEAGPYEVAVVGTLFSVQWDPSTGVDVEVVRGKVVVRGESLGADAIAVDAGHRLRADHTRRTLTLGPLRPEPEQQPEPEPEPETTPDEPAIEDVPATPRTTPEPRRARRAGPTWKTEASAANYDVALGLARAQGLDGLLADLPAGDLLLLAETARLAKDRTLARRTYERVRARFGNSPQASRAAFQLGRLAADGAGKHAEAARWFATYLRESPSGAFAREARGRLVQSLDRAGDAAGARAAAKNYLALHPTGPHAKLARSIAGAGP